VLTGPVKSGKTDVLRLVLPSLIAREYRTGKSRPFIFHFTFNLRQGPRLAAEYFLQRLKATVAPLGIRVDIDNTPGWALNFVPVILGAVALELSKKKNQAELWLLMDEAQVCGIVQQ
jgi:hypothetical protein